MCLSLSSAPASQPQLFGEVPRARQCSLLCIYRHARQHKARKRAAEHPLAFLGCGARVETWIRACVLACCRDSRSPCLSALTRLLGFNTQGPDASSGSFLSPSCDPGPAVTLHSTVASGCSSLGLPSSGCSWFDRGSMFTLILFLQYLVP